MTDRELILELRKAYRNNREYREFADDAYIGALQAVVESLFSKHDDIDVLEWRLILINKIQTLATDPVPPSDGLDLAKDNLQ